MRVGLKYWLVLVSVAILCGALGWLIASRGPREATDDSAFAHPENGRGTEPFGNEEPQFPHLEGLQGVHVLVFPPDDPEVERRGLREAEIQTDVELRLRKAGIKVLSLGETLKTAGQPVLYVIVHTAAGRGPTEGLYAYNVNMQLMENVVLDRDPSMKVKAATWTFPEYVPGYVGMVGADKLRATRDYLNTVVDEFINDYLAANP